MSDDDNAAAAADAMLSPITRSMAATGNELNDDALNVNDILAAEDDDDDDESSSSSSSSNHQIEVQDTNNTNNNNNNTISSSSSSPLPQQQQQSDASSSIAATTVVNSTTTTTTTTTTTNGEDDDDDDDDDDDASDSAATTSSAESTDDDDDDDEEEEEEEEEPKLKYQRMGASVPDILKQDTVRCFCVHDKFLVMGTHQGRLHVLDVSGNEIHRYDAHRAPVNCISLDEAGEHMASCSDDGAVAITNLYSHEKTVHNYHRAVNAVAIHPLYEKTTMFATGGLNQQLILNTKGWFSSKDNVIHAGEGPIYAVAWRNSMIAWANDEGVKVYDVQTQERICHVGRPKSSPPPAKYQCHLCWTGEADGEDRLIVAWADFIKVGVVRTRAANAAPAQQQAKDLISLTKIVKPRDVRYMAIVANIQTDFWIAGVAPYGPNLVLLAYIDPDTADVDNVVHERPELRIVSPTNEDIACDALPILGFEHYVCTDYRLEYSGGDDPLFYVVSPKDVVVARPRDVDDRITWLLARERYKEALEAAETNRTVLKQHEYLDIGEKYLKHLMDEGEYEEAAHGCSKLLKDNPKLWETWIYVFAKYRQLQVISHHIPIVDPQLDSTLYEMVLSQFIASDHEGLLYTIRKWPHHIYSVPTVITAILHRLRELKEQNADTLLDALGELYLMDRQYDRALQVHLKLKRKDVFDLVKRLDLLDSVRNKVHSLMLFDSERAVELFISERERIPVDDVVAQLNDHRQLLHVYLDALYQVDNQAGSKYHQLQVSLYADYEPDKLLVFLRNSHHYVLEDALKICRQKQLYREQVFILKRMGNTSDALNLLVEKLHDIQHAVEFVEEQKDDQLWETLITHSLAKPQLLSDLLEHVGSHYVDPLRLMRRVPSEMEIPGLKGKLKKILDDQMLQVSLRQGCNNILQSDVVTLMQRHVNERRRGVRGQPEDKCLVCDGMIAMGTSGSVTVFFCKHMYHTDCVKNHRIDRRKTSQCIHPNCQQHNNNSAKSHHKRRLPPPSTTTTTTTTAAIGGVPSLSSRRGVMAPSARRQMSLSPSASASRANNRASVYFTAAQQSPEKSRSTSINLFGNSSGKGVSSSPPPPAAAAAATGTVPPTRKG